MLHRGTCVGLEREETMNAAKRRCNAADKQYL